jgi:hypothetical protein
MIDGAYQQAGFDARIMNLPLIGDQVIQNPGALYPYVDSALARGYIKQEHSSYTGRIQPVYACAFLYNPSTVEVTHGIDASAASLTLPQYQRNPDDSGTYLVGLSSALNFSLLFDRTYEMNSMKQLLPSNLLPYPDRIPQPDGTFATEDPREIGVLADVRALYRVCGIQGASVTQTWVDGGGTSRTNVVNGSMMQIPSWVYFSNNNFGSSFAKDNLAYYGYISGLDIQYTHFNMSMMPMRCAVAIAFTLLPNLS